MSHSASRKELSSPETKPLPPHTVRESRRAKNVHLRLSLRGGLEVVVPSGFDLAEIPELLRRKERWILRAGRQLAEERRQLDPRPHDQLPDEIVLRALGETWAVKAVFTSSSRLCVREQAGQGLQLSGPVADPAAWRPALKRWVARRARLHLAECVEAEASAHGLRYEAVAVRWQESRWGSCSRQGRSQGKARLSLNATLLFLPPHLVRYVVLHELCHTEQMNHSAAFWSRLSAVEPQSRALRDELRAAWRYAPSWLASSPVVDAFSDRA